LRAVFNLYRVCEGPRKEGGKGRKTVILCFAMYSINSLEPMTKTLGYLGEGKEKEEKEGRKKRGGGKGGVSLCQPFPHSGVDEIEGKIMKRDRE